MNRIFQNFADWIGTDHEVTESVKEAVSERLYSPFYGYLLISWLIINWDYIYRALFVDGEQILEKTGLLKDEYLLQVVLPNHLWSFEYWINFLILPMLLTTLAFWVMPYLIGIFYKKHIDNRVYYENIKNKALAKKVQQETAVLEAEQKKGAAIEKIKKTSPEVLWRSEFEEFKKNKELYPKFQTMIDNFYKYNGYKTYQWGNDPWNSSDVDDSMIVYADVNNLIELNGNSFNFTPKGKLFVKLYIDANKF